VRHGERCHRVPSSPGRCSGSEAGRGGFNCSAERPESISVHTDAPVFVKSVTNGKRYLGGSGNDTFHVVHLYSETDNLYEMGFALGQLFPQEIADMFDTIEPWLERLLESAVPWLPEWLADLVIKYGASCGTGLRVRHVTKDYIPKDYLETEWAGIAAR
jgi:hypothetical protein